VSDRLILRTPSHLGDLVMALPAVVAARPAAVVVPAHLAALLPLAQVDAAILPLGPGARGVLAAVPRVRRGRFDRGVLLAPSFSSAFLLRAGGVRRVRGTDTDHRRMLLDDAVARKSVIGLHRMELYHFIVTGERPQARPVSRLAVPEALAHDWRKVFNPGSAVVAGVFPGTRASARRWDADRFASIVRRLAADGMRVIVFGGPSECALTRAVAGTSAFDAGGRTDVALLAAALHACHILVSNDSGPMHLAAAVGTPVVSIWGAGDPLITGITGPAHTMVRRLDLPCVPCVRNACPRRGPGTILPAAYRECMNLIGVEDVLGAIRASVRP